MLLIYFTPNYFNKHTAEVAETKPLRETAKRYYHDLDGDGLTEHMNVIFNDGEYFPAIVFYDSKNRVINQWNLRGNWLPEQKLFSGDYNDNGEGAGTEVIIKV